ncbi:GAF domain-containing protein [Streptosporangium becharense]|uniref:protein-serine/threonine phosphatase n=1 Tax=Streptosporangium becharense TaxID=1816182 RepID=A0A7W9IB58_9ACTN|nr:SpoIIE family protein phosphatase [Streptosporangium becharense]MBB2910805.1 GAF domain-containing protein [Streptosporangium becharense]MBB5817500.1 GAF domain-containing protein [Streptosporangium becharense]
MRDHAVPSGGPDLDPLDRLDQLLIQTMQEVGAAIGMIYLLPPGDQVLRLAVLGGISREFAGPWERVALAAPIPVADAVRERRLVWVGTQADMASRYPRAALTLPYHFALAASPILTGTICWGALVLLWPGIHPPRLTPGEAGVIGVSCRRMGAILRRAADSGHPLSPEPEPHMLVQPRLRTVDPAEALAAVDFAERLPEGCCALDTEGRIVFVTTTAADLLGRRGADLLGELPRKALPWLDDLTYEDRYRSAMIGRRPVSFTALRPPDRWLTFRLYPDATGISVRITPSEATGDPGGAADEPAAPEGRPIRAGALYHLMHLAATLTEAVSVQDVVDLVADQIMPAYDAQGLILFVTEGGRLRGVGQRGYSADALDHFDRISHDLSQSPAARAMISGVPNFFASPEEMERVAPGIPELTQKCAWAFLPLITSGRPVGCCVLSYRQPHPFPDDERAILTSLAGLIAQALDRARLYDAKHQLAQGLQEALLPHALPSLPGLGVAARYRPATLGMDIGGDFYDLLRLDDTTVAAVIGDVQGHNVTAAALMGQVRTAVHAYASAGAAPGEVLARTNRLLIDLDPDLFASCLYAHLDLARHRAYLTTAGHPPALLRHPDGRTEVLHIPPGPLLGIDPGADYLTVEIVLPPGAVLALYTDGLIETPGADLGEAVDDLAARLGRARYVSMDDLADTLVRQVRHADSRSDDIALLLLNPRPDGEEPARPVTR